MKNTILYYYGIDIIDIKKCDNSYYLFSKDFCFLFEECKRNINELNDLVYLTNYLINHGLPYNRIIINKLNSYITLYNEKEYILMQVFNNDIRKININDINNCNLYISNTYIFNNIIKNNWITLWMNKIDNIENLIDSNSNKYSKLSESIDYYIGIAENAIMLLQDINVDSADLFISHYRVNYNYRVRDLYNPLNIILDIRVRDIALYIKSMYLNNLISFDKVVDVMNSINMNNELTKLFFIRILFPDFYFDEIDNIINNNISKVKIDTFRIKYKELIINLYNYLFFRGILPDIEWIKKER